MAAEAAAVGFLAALALSDLALAPKAKAARTVSYTHLHDLEQFTLIQMNLGREVSRRLRDADEELFRLRQVAAPD